MKKNINQDNINFYSSKLTIFLKKTSENDFIRESSIPMPKACFDKKASGNIEF